MPLVNPASNLYANMDIQNLDRPAKRQESKGLLAPNRMPMPEQSTNMSSEPAFRVGQHMLIMRKQRERLTNV